MARVSSPEMRSSSAISGPRTLYCSGFAPKGPASRKPKVSPGTPLTAWRAWRRVSLKPMPWPFFSLT